MAKHVSDDGDNIADYAQQLAVEQPEAHLQPYMSELTDALDETGYVHVDPTADPTFPRITEPDPLDDLPDVFPEGWSSEPTMRDQAAIDAGNT